MSHSGQLADRIRVELGQQLSFEEAPVMSGLGFFAGGRLVVGVLEDTLCVRVAEGVYDDHIGESGVEPYEFAGRPVPGWLAIQETVLDDDRLVQWIKIGLDIE